MGRIDIITGTLGKALGGASGGFTSGRKEIIDLLRQRSRPYLFSNSIPPAIAAASIAALDLLKTSTALIDRLRDNTTHFRTEMTKLGFNLLPGEHPIVPIMLGDASLAGRFAEAMLARGVYVIGFSYPVVPQGKARIRTQMSAALTHEDLDTAIHSFAEVGREMKLIA
jgi:glycine C-acetyltransferase